MSRFNDAYPMVVFHEGGYSNNPNDKGNWTGGKIGVGELKGTKYGISAAAYPNLDIQNITQQQAMDIAKHEYWDVMHCDEIPWPLSLFVFDCAYNQGVTAATSLLQDALGVDVDGRFGPITLRAAQNPRSDTAAKFMAKRALKYIDTQGWNSFGFGWFKRLFALSLET